MRSLVRRLGGAYLAAFSDLPASTWWVCLVALVNRCGTMVLPFLALYLTHDRGLGPSRAGLLLSGYGLGSIFGGLLGGWLTDRLSAVRVFALSLAATGIGFLTLGALESTTAIAGTMFMIALLGEGYRPASMALLMSTCPKKARTRAMALNRLAINAGMTLAPVLGGFLITTVGYQWLFWIDGGTCLVAVAMLPLIPLAAAAPPEGAEEKARGDRSPWTDGPFLGFLAFNVVLGLIFFQAEGTFLLYLDAEYRLEENFIGLLFAVNTVLIVSVEMLVVHRLERRNHLAVIGWGALLTGAGFALLPFGRSFGFAACAVVVWTFGEILSSGFSGALVANRAGEKNRGRYMGLFMVSFGVAFTLAPAAGTALYEHVSPETLWAVCGALGIVLWFGARALGRTGFGAPD